MIRAIASPQRKYALLVAVAVFVAGAAIALLRDAGQAGQALTARGAGTAETPADRNQLDADVRRPEAPDARGAQEFDRSIRRVEARRLKFVHSRRGKQQRVASRTKYRSLDDSRALAAASSQQRRVIETPAWSSPR